jgi:hypothetical protein
MPRKDGTGPLGEGPLSGKGRGGSQSCSPQSRNQDSKRQGLGFRNRAQSFGVNSTTEGLINEKTALEKRIAEIDQRIKK